MNHKLSFFIRRINDLKSIAFLALGFGLMFSIGTLEKGATLKELGISFLGFFALWIVIGVVFRALWVVIEHSYLLLTDQASKGLDDVKAGRTQDARAALRTIREKRKSDVQTKNPN